MSERETQMRQELNQVRKRFHEATGGMNYCLDVFGDELAKREGYKNLTGMDAIHFYLVHKFSWLPRDVISMSQEHIRFVLSQELADWTLPPDALG
jgi:hypothetical protein